MSTITVTIVFALPERAIEIELRLAAGATVADALAGFPAEKVRDIALSQAPVGIFGRRVEQDHVLADRDRVEIYRPLIAEPKAARRRRALRPTRR